MSFFVVEIALPVPLHRTFDYLPAQDDTQEHYLPGQRVRAEFGRQLLTGIVVGCKSATDVPTNKLRALLERCDDSPLIDEHSMALCRWLADYYHHSLGEVLEHMLPVMLRRGCALTEANERRWRRIAQRESQPKLRGDKQTALWAKFQHSEYWPHTAMTQAGFTLAQLKRFVELELIVEEDALPLPSIPAVNSVFHTIR